MTCTNCSTAVERVLHGLRGVRRANVALALGEARVAYDPTCTDEVCACVPCCGLLHAHTELSYLSAVLTANLGV